MSATFSSYSFDRELATHDADTSVRKGLVTRVIARLLNSMKRRLDHPCNKKSLYEPEERGDL